MLDCSIVQRNTSNIFDLCSMYEKLPFSYIRYQTYTENARNMNSKLRWQKVLGSSEEWLFPRGQGARSDHTAAGQGPLQLGSK